MSEAPLYRTAVVTGATGGIGRAIVTVLRSRGLTVHAVGRNRAALADLAAETGARPIEADVRDTAAITAALAGAEVDVLVNNAGILSTREAFQAIDPTEIDAMIDINLKAPLRLTHAVLPGMVARQRGHLIFVGSIAGQAPYPASAVYGASKAGLSLFCDALRLDLLGTSVRVTEVVPGRVQTALYGSTLGGDRANELLYDGYRPIQPDHIARIVGQIVDLPEAVDVARIEVLPTDQAIGGGTMVKHG